MSTFDVMALDQVSLLGHSFGGGIELGFAALFPNRVTEVVFSDTLAASREWQLADEALRHPLRLARLATPTALVSFTRSWVEHPRQLLDAAWWGFTSGRGATEGGRPSRRAGTRPVGVPSTTTRMFQQAGLFFDHLAELGLKVLSA